MEFIHVFIRGVASINNPFLTYFSLILRAISGQKYMTFSLQKKTIGKILVILL